jgi:plasmid stabilization system protein ParE
MDNYKIIWSPKSIKSLEKIHQFYFEKSETAAKKLKKFLK